MLKSGLAFSALMVGFSCTLGTGTASAASDPDLTPLIDTTCNYSQVIAGINDLDPGMGGEIANFPPAANRLQQFLALPNDQRQQFVDGEVASHPRAQEIIDAIEGDPGGQKDITILDQVSKSCGNYPADPGAPVPGPAPAPAPAPVPVPVPAPVPVPPAA